MAPCDSHSLNVSSDAHAALYFSPGLNERQSTACAVMCGACLILLMIKVGKSC